MATTRPRISSNGKKKSIAPPVLDEVVGDDTASPRTTGQPTAQVTNTRLEERQIPSFSESREARIAEAAYWRAERRGFAPGHELDDWLEAERSVDGTEQHGR